MIGKGSKVKKMPILQFLKPTISSKVVLHPRLLSLFVYARPLLLGVLSFFHWLFTKKAFFCFSHSTKVEVVGIGSWYLLAGTDGKTRGKLSWVRWFHRQYGRSGGAAADHLPSDTLYHCAHDYLLLNWRLPPPPTHPPELTPWTASNARRRLTRPTR